MADNLTTFMYRLSNWIALSLHHRGIYVVTHTVGAWGSVVVKALRY